MAVSQFNVLFHVHAVHYAAEIGAQGLDIQESLLRKEIFKEMNEVSSDTVALQMMDKTIPWQPEPIRYQVVQIERSKKLYQYVRIGTLSTYTNIIK